MPQAERPSVEPVEAPTTVAEAVPSLPRSEAGKPRFDVTGDGYADLALLMPCGTDDEATCLYLWRGSPAGLVTAARGRPIPAPASESYYLQLAMASDINGDGHDDVLLGIPRRQALWGQCMEEMGAAHVVFGSASGLSDEDTPIVVNGLHAGLFGAALAGGEDLDGDGYGDAMVIAGGGTFGECTTQKVLDHPHPDAFVLHGSASGFRVPDAATYIPLRDGNLVSGARVDMVRDTGGDGHPDVVLLGPGDRNGTADLYVLSLTECALAKRAVAPNRSTAFTYVGAGDVNGDGTTDLLVIDGRDRSRRPQRAKLIDAGTMHQRWTRRTYVDFAMRNKVAICDVQGDGFDDVLVGERDQARVSVYYGSRKGLGRKPNLVIEGETPESRFGLIYCDDYNGDGIADLVVLGTPDKLFFYAGSPQGLAPVTVQELPAPKAP